MTSNRSKQILALIKNSNNDIQSINENQNFEFTGETTREHLRNTSADERSSPLPPEAEAILCEQNMRDIWNEVFLDNNHQEESCATLVSPSILPVSISACAEVSTCESPIINADCQTEKVIYSNDVIVEDAYIPTDALTPISVNNCQSIGSLLQYNIDSPTPLTPIFNDLSCQASPVTQNVEQPNQTAITTPPHSQKPPTPVPSPINRHAICNDLFCSQHEIDEFACPSVSTIDTESNQPSPAPLIRNRGKKRLRNYKEWGDIKRKELKNHGKVYCSKRGRTVEAKVMGPPCRCRFKCSTKISKEKRTEIFKKFWELGDVQKQWLFIANYTKKQNKARTYQRELKHNRVYTYNYYIPKTESNTVLTHEKLDVCKVMFLNTLGITERMTRTAWQKYDGSTAVEQDLRGRHNNHRKVLDDEMTKSVCAHVNSFVPVESHYCRKSSKRLYLEGSLSVARMFKMYNEWPDLVKYSKKAATLRQYRDIVNTNFNLSFHVTKKDTCDQCHIFKHNENPSEELKADYKEHQTNKTIARHMKNTDKTDAGQSNGTVLCATFDFQKVLTCPHGQISVLYYKRKLSCYNFTIYDLTTKVGICYVWDESVAKRGSNEVASCLYNFIKDFSGKGVKDYRFWSDNCAGQNKNRIVFAMYTYAAKEFGVSITHRFLEKGHTQNEGDSVHSVIERAGQNKVIYTPEEWKLLIRWAKTENPYEVRDVTKEQVYDFKDLLKNKNWTKNTENVKINWTKIKEIIIAESHPYKILYKYSLTDNYSMTLVVRKETRNFTATTLNKAYFGPVAISNDKFKDLINLCETGIIPTKHHDYFNSLPHSCAASNENDDDSD